MLDEEKKMNYVDDATDEQWSNRLIHCEKIL
jgi:hypothetical protein